MSKRVLEALLKTKRIVADITAEERYYSRSMKIRYGVMAALANLADNDHPQSQLKWESMEDLGAWCGNFILNEGWDLKPASSVTCARWCRQYFLMNGDFQTVPEGSGLFHIAWRSEDSRLLVRQVLKQYKGRQRRLPFPKEKKPKQKSLGLKSE